MEVKRRIVLGKKAMEGLNKKWKDKNISQVTKVRLVKAVVFPVATYARETWTMIKTEKRELVLINFGAGGSCRAFLGQRKKPTCLLNNK